jgi:hypothetical protein
MNQTQIANSNTQSTSSNDNLPNNDPLVFIMSKLLLYYPLQNGDLSDASPHQRPNAVLHGDNICREDCVELDREKFIAFPSNELIQTSNFSMYWSMKVPEQRWSHNQFILGDWSSYNWMFCVRCTFLQDQQANFIVELRREMYTGGSDPTQGLVDAQCTIETGRWTHVGFTFCRENRSLTLYVDGLLSAVGTIPDWIENIDLKHSSSPHFYAGLKHDEGNARRSYFNGCLRDLILLEGVVEPIELQPLQLDASSGSFLLK